MRPDVALAFDRMDRAACADGVALVIISALRSDAEQAELWRRHPDPRSVAPPGKSLHRNGTELDLGPPAAYGWLAAHAELVHSCSATAEASGIRGRRDGTARRRGPPGREKPVGPLGAGAAILAPSRRRQDLRVARGRAAPTPTRLH
jgi:hypothetical protein